MENKKNQYRIGIDARFYGPRQKGLGRYVQKLIEGLEEIDNQNRYFIFLRKENFSDYRPKNPNFTKVMADYKWYGLSEQIIFPFKIRQSQLDLIHFPHFNVPVFCPALFVVTIHDLILKKFATRREYFFGFVRYWLKNTGYSLVISSALKKAQKIIAVSHYTKNDILKHFRVNPGKIKVVYEGAGRHLTSSKAATSDSAPNAFRISKPYLLYVGNAYPHKNLERLISAFERLNRGGGLRLVLVGELDYFYRRLKNRFAGVDGLIFADFVSDGELATLYQNAVLYVFPSLCEGFGLPPLEAMAYGLPVVCADSSCLPEILGKAAAYFDPENSADMAQKINAVLDDENLQKKMIAAGFEKIKKYDWPRMAKEILGIYLDSAGARGVDYAD